MPKITPFEKINDKKFTFVTEIKITKFDCRVQTPIRLGRQIPKGKKVKVTIEVIDEWKKSICIFQILQ